VVVIEGTHWVRLRNWGPHPGAAGIQFDRHLGWAPVPDYFTPDHGGIQFNRNGYRSAEMVEDMPTIALIGDSVVFGIGLAGDETPSAYLAELAAPHGLQVQNLGVAGFGLDQTYLRLGQEIDGLPDLRWVVLVVCSDNDRENCRCNHAEGKRKPLFVIDGRGIRSTSVPIDANCARNHLETSPLGPWAWRLFGLWPVNDWLPRMIGDRCLEDDPLDIVVERLIRATANLATSKGARFSAVVIPHRQEYGGEPGLGEWWRQMLVRQGVELLDFWSHAQELGLPVDEIYGDPVHLTPEGSRELAAFLAAHAEWPGDTAAEEG
jgi:hypothetical protein